MSGVALPTKIYNGIVKTVEPYVPKKFQPFWQHPTGQKTVPFWAPAFKWGLVIAGLGDLARPAEQLSIAQSTSIAATGTIWSRSSLVIFPKNWGLSSVNVFVAITQVLQLGRAYMHHKEQEKLKAAENKN